MKNFGMKNGLTISALSTCLIASVAADLAGAQVIHPEGEIRPNHAPASERFGRSVALEGDRLVVGAPERGSSAQGAVFVLERQPDGSWLQVAELSPPQVSSLVRFGSNVALSGDRIATSCENSSIEQVVVHERDGSGVWQQTSVQIPEVDDFGYGASLALDGDLIAVGVAGFEIFNFFPRRVHLYVHAGATWQLLDSVPAPASGIAPGWAESIDLDGLRLAIGSTSDDSSGVADSGAVYIAEYQSASAQWSIVETVHEPTPESGSRFGKAVALDGDRLVVGAWSADSVAADAGEVHVYARQSDGTWQHEAALAPGTLQSGDGFGLALDVDDDTLVVGAPGAQAQNGAHSGAAYLFTRRANGTWFESARIERELPTSFDALGDGTSTSIAIDAGTVVLGAQTAQGFGGDVSHLRLGALLHGDTEIASTTGGAQTLALRAGEARAGDAYLVLGSLSGTTPGTPIGGGVTLPLVLDGYTNLTAALAGPIVAPFGLLGPDGEATATYFVPQPVAAAFVGTTVHHAFVTIDLLTFASSASNAVEARLVP